MIWSGRLAFDMGYISAYTCVALTIERWCAVVKPTTYLSVKSKTAVYTVIFVWFWGFAVNLGVAFRVEYNEAEKRCAWTSIPGVNEEVTWISLTVQSFIPYTTMVVLYIHIYCTLKKLPRLNSNRDVQLRRVTVVAWLACSALILGWMPGRVTFTLTKYGYLDPDGVVHFTCVMITFLNSCFNPFLYGIYSPVFRAEYKEVFHYFFRKTADVISRGLSSVKPARDDGQVNSQAGKPGSDKNNVPTYNRDINQGFSQNKELTQPRLEQRCSAAVSPDNRQDFSVPLALKKVSDNEKGKSSTMKPEKDHPFSQSQEPEPRLEQSNSQSVGPESSKDLSITLNTSSDIDKSNPVSVKAEDNEGFSHNLEPEPCLEKGNSHSVEPESSQDLSINLKTASSDVDKSNPVSVKRENEEEKTANRTGEKTQNEHQNTHF